MRENALLALSGVLNLALMVIFLASYQKASDDKSVVVSYV